MKLKLKRGTTGKLLRIFVQDSSRTDGAGLTGLAYNSAGLAWHYLREGDSSPAAVTLATATVGAWTSGGFKEVSAASMPGVYELGVPDAALAPGAASVVMMLRGATNMAPVLIEIELDGVDYQDATRLGLSALPNASAGASGGLPTVDASNAVKVQSGTGANQMALSSGQVTVGTNNDKAGYGLSAGERDSVADALLDRANGIEPGITFRQAMRLMEAVLLGLAAETSGTVVFKRKDGTTTALTVVHDSTGNRTSVTIGTV